MAEPMVEKTADGAAADEAAGDRQSVLRGAGVALEAVSAALLNEPSDEVVATVSRVAAALGDGRFEGIEAAPELTQRFFDRMVVSCTPYFVPLAEGPVSHRVPMDGRVRYGSYQSAVGDHVLRCYKAVGFDYRSVPCCGRAKTMVHPDSLGCELAFLAQLAFAAAHEGAGASRAEELLGEFIARHTRWYKDAASCLAASADDYYARLVAFAADTVEFLAGFVPAGR